MMKNQVKVGSRILVAVASLGLTALYFLPAWQILLFAPQYPEGLRLDIWINKISGDVDIINGLNHYIGMKPISEEMFPEFSFLPYVIAGFIIFGLAVAFSGNRKLLFWFVMLVLAGAILVPYDLYRWGYSYGHDLDPMAAIQVPGLSYQPPVFGHKRLLNFDAYSFPGTAGWIAAAGCLMAASVWFWEWYHHRKLKSITRENQKVILVASILVVVSLSSCSVQPEPLVIGNDNCEVCRMGIADLRFGGEVITKKGKLYKFDDIGCMMGFLSRSQIQKAEISRTLVVNFDKPQEFVDASEAWFLLSPDIRSPMNSNVSGFSSREDAENLKGESNGEIMKWNDLVRRKFE